LLSQIGFDILYFNSLEDKVIDQIDTDNKFSIKFEFAKKIPISPFPKKESLLKIETPAFIAENIVDLNEENDDINIIRPWQYKDYKVKSISLKTGFEELFNIWNLPAKERQGFKIEKESVFIPNVLTKINGIDENIALYWGRVGKLLKVKESFILPIDRMPILKRVNRPNCKEYIDNRGLINKDRIKKARDHNLIYLSTAKQDNILDKANELIEKDYLLLDKDMNLRINIVQTIFDLNKDIIKLIQIFDYPFNIPKVFIYDTSEKIFSVEDCILVLLLHMLGIDIVIMTPSGFNNIETYVNTSIIDIHNLEKLEFNLDYPKDIRKTIKMKKPAVNKSLKDYFKSWFIM
jgi:hypothetical protein